MKPMYILRNSYSNEIEYLKSVKMKETKFTEKAIEAMHFCDESSAREFAEDLASVGIYCRVIIAGRDWVV